MSTGGQGGAGKPAPTHAPSGLRQPVHLGNPAGAGKTIAVIRYLQQLAQPVVVGRNQTGLLDIWQLSQTVSAGIRGASHGDLHPANIILPDNASPVLVDFRRWSPHHPSPHTPPAAEEPEPDLYRVDDLYRLDHRSSFERELGVNRELSAAAAKATLSEYLLELAQLLGRRVTRVDRSAARPARGPSASPTAAAGATRAQERPEPHQLVQLFTKVLRRIAKTLGRLLSLSRGEPDECEPPGQLVTAHPHVTRGPTSSRAAMVLSAPREPMLV